MRTRSAAAALVEAGYVRLNGARVTAAGHPLRAGDVLTLALDSSVRLIRVEGFAGRRGGARDAAALFHDLAPPRSG